MARKFERFKEVRQIGAGAFGKTLLVEDLTEGSRRVVIKVPLNEETEAALIDDLINNAVLPAPKPKPPKPIPVPAPKPDPNRQSPSRSRFLLRLRTRSHHQNPSRSHRRSATLGRPRASSTGRDTSIRTARW